MPHARPAAWSVSAIRPAERRRERSGCRECMKVCQFGAIAYGAAEKKSVVDARRCYGCGICRAACAGEAISLLDRAAVPAGANLW